MSFPFSQQITSEMLCVVVDSPPPTPYVKEVNLS